MTVGRTARSGTEGTSAVVAMIVDAVGVRPAPNVADIRGQVDAKRFFWLDIFGGDGATRSLHLSQLGLAETDITWALRFGQAGRMFISRDKLRAVTWMADATGNLVEVHIISCPQCIMTVWSGDATALDAIRQQFAERVAGLENNFYYAAGILLQLLLGTLDATIEKLDAVFDDLRVRLDRDSSAVDFGSVTRHMQGLQSRLASFSRYSSAVRSALIGIEAMPGIDARGVAELNDYIEQVEDVEEQLHQRRRWMSDLMHDHSTALAQRQGEQINRLTLVSLIFLPVTALTGFFGMNFDWLSRVIAGREAFLLLGLALPALCVLLTVAWLAHRGLIQLPFWRSRAGRTPQVGQAHLGEGSNPPGIRGHSNLAVPPEATRSAEDAE